MHRNQHWEVYGCRDCTHVRLDVEVLEVEGVLPNVDADDGDKRQKGVLVGGRRDLETLGRRVEALQSRRFVTVRSVKRPTQIAITCTGDSRIRNSDAKRRFASKP